MKLRTPPSGPDFEGTLAGQVLAWDGTSWVPADLPAFLPENLVFDGPNSGATSANTTYVAVGSIGFEVPADQTFRLQWSGFVSADTGLTAIEHRVHNVTAPATIGGPVRREIASALEVAMVSGFLYLEGPVPFSVYELQFRRAAGIGTATAQQMCIEAQRVF